ncbi:MAG: hypothetical protein ACM3XO_13860 [Bacteroidota bacterium]
MVHSEDYSPDRFEITGQDLDHLAAILVRSGVPQDLKTMALAAIKRRMENGPDPCPAVPACRRRKPAVRFWDPEVEWEVGEAVLLLHDPFGNSKYELFVGEVIHLDEEVAEIKIEELQGSRTCLRTLPGSQNAQKYGTVSQTWREMVAELAGNKLRSADPDELAEGLLLQNGEHILSCLLDALHSDPRFTGLDGKWCLVKRLPHVDPESVQAVHHFLLQNQSATLNEILPVVQAGRATEASLMKIAIHFTLQHSPDRFENAGTPGRPLWKARLPAHDQAQVTHFAFDPQTFEILCRPGQRLSQRLARRLQELNLYAYVVTFPEWHLQPGP